MLISPSSKVSIAITMGDPSGIGPEITLKALAKSSIRSLADFIIVGDKKVLQKSARSLNKACLHLLRKTEIMDLGNVAVKSFSFGKQKASYGGASIKYIQKAYELVEAKRVSGIVTSPINKSSVKKAGFKFPGHTEFLASLAGTSKFVMMLAGGPLKVSLVTRHIALNSVSKKLSIQNITNAIRITLKSLKKDFNIPHPKIAVCALNPHAGESGIFGNEELKIITPAVSKFKKEAVKGPISADAVFYDAYRGKFDCVICLYHDQGLIPLKMIARDTGVNVTLGLPFVRTSPDHGTAFDIAGRGKADSRSMEAAIRLAVSMAGNRKVYAK